MGTFCRGALEPSQHGGFHQANLEGTIKVAAVKAAVALRCSLTSHTPSLWLCSVGHTSRSRFSVGKVCTGCGCQEVCLLGVVLKGVQEPHSQTLPVYTAEVLALVLAVALCQCVVGNTDTEQRRRVSGVCSPLDPGTRANRAVASTPRPPTGVGSADYRCVVPALGSNLVQIPGSLQRSSPTAPFLLWCHPLPVHPHSSCVAVVHLIMPLPCSSQPSVSPPTWLLLFHGRHVALCFQGPLS